MILTKVISASLDSVGRRIVKVLRLGKTDVQTGMQAVPFGVDSNPIPGMRAIFSDTLRKGDNVVVGYLNDNQLAEPGEIRLFSVDADGNLKTFLWLKKDGTIEIGGSSNHMTRFEALESAFNQFKSDFNSHTHASNGTPPVTPTTADVSGAKIDEVKTI